MDDGEREDGLLLRMIATIQLRLALTALDDPHRTPLHRDLLACYQALFAQLDLRLTDYELRLTIAPPSSGPPKTP